VGTAQLKDFKGFQLINAATAGQGQVEEKIAA